MSRTKSKTVRATPADSSSDGKYVVYTSDQGGSTHIWMVEVATGVTTELTLGFSSDSRPAFSPSGRQIAYVSNGNVWTLDLNAGTQALAASSPAIDTSPAWSPNGDFIAFASNRDGDFDIMRYTSNGCASVDRERPGARRLPHLEEVESSPRQREAAECGVLGVRHDA